MRVRCTTLLGTLICVTLCHADWQTEVASLTPIGWWQLDETTGPVAVDATGNHDGVHVGTTLNQMGQVGGAADFSGTAFVQFGDVLDLETSSFTLVSVFKKTSTSQEFMKLINKGQTSSGTPSNAGYQQRIRDGMIEARATDGSGNSVLVEIKEPLVDEWHFFATAFDRNAGEFRLHLDPCDDRPYDVAQFLGSFGNVNTNIPFAIGALDRGAFGSTSEYFQGLMDEVVVFDRALTGAEIKGLFDTTGITSPTCQCDFDWDGDCEVDDLDMLVSEGPIDVGVAVTPTNEQYDINGDGSIDLMDRDLWLELGATANGYDSPYKLGDANLDGTVDGQDFLAWNGAKFGASLLWSDANFNGDAVVDGQDFLAWNANKFTSSDAVSVPEPASCAVLLALITMAGFRWRNS